MARPLPSIEKILSDASDDFIEEIIAPQREVKPFPKDLESYISDFDLTTLLPYPDHKFRTWEGERFQGMVDSIKERGILHPLIVWDRGDPKGTFIILSGHNRQLAAIEAGKSKGPVIIKRNISAEEADLIVTETNLLQRSFADLRHSERAYCLKQHNDAMKKQGKRADLIREINDLFSNANPHEIKENATFYQFDKKLSTGEKLAEEYCLSAANVARYIRIAELINYLMELLDKDIIPFMAAYAIAFISQDKQMEIADILKVNPDYKIDIKKATKLRGEFENGRLISQKIISILEGRDQSKRGKKINNNFRIKPTVMSKYFTKGESKKEIETIVELALEKYFDNPE